VLPLLVPPLLPEPEPPVPDPVEPLPPVDPPVPEPVDPPVVVPPAVEPPVVEPVVPPVVVPPIVVPLVDPPDPVDPPDGGLGVPGAGAGGVWVVLLESLPQPMNVSVHRSKTARAAENENRESLERSFIETSTENSGNGNWIS